MPREHRLESNTTRAHEPRNQRFGSNKPFDDEPSLNLLGANGSLRFFNPTSAQYSWRGWNPAHDEPSSPGGAPSIEHVSPEQQSDEEEQEQEPEGHFPAKRKDDVLSFVWRSRDNRKGRHTLVLRRGEHGEKQPHGTLQPTNTLPATLHGIIALFTKFPYWDLSWWVAITITLGSTLWIANGFIVWLPQLGDGSSDAMDAANAWSGFVAAAVFLFGSVLLLLEAVNANRSGCFGWAVERTVKGQGLEAEVHPGCCEHHHYESKDNCHFKKSHGYDADDDAAARNSSDEMLADRLHRASSRDALLPKHDAHHMHTYDWKWWPSYYDLRTHFLYEIGFLACCIQLVSALLFWLSRIAMLPSISPHVSQPVADATHWAPQIIGCLGFIAACWLFMIETQPYWYMPAPSVLGWHVGFWKLVGCVGFLASAVLGLAGEHGVESATAHSSGASFWASWAILLGSLVQWYESLDKYPVVEEGTSRYSEWNEKFIKESEKRRNTEDD